MVMLKYLNELSFYYLAAESADLAQVHVHSNFVVVGNQLRAILSLYSIIIIISHNFFFFHRSG